MNTNLLRYRILRWIPRILILAVIGFSAFVYYSYDEKKKERQNKPFITNPYKSPTQQQLAAIEYSHFDNQKLVYHVKAEKTFLLKNKQQRLENPEFIFYDENQKETIRITGKNCLISKDFNTITVSDDTVVRSADKMIITTHNIKYDSRLRQFSTRHPAHFDWKTMKARARGFLYKVDSEKLLLPEEPQIEYINRLSENRQPIVLKGNFGMIDRKAGFAYVEGDVTVTQGNDKIRAHRLEVEFVPGGNNIHKITAIKNVDIKFARPNRGQAQQTAETAPKTEPVSQIANVFTADDSSAKELQADFVELYFYQDGSTIRAFHSTGDCTFGLRSFDGNKAKENRIIKGQTFDAAFNEVGDMTEFKAKHNVSVKLQPLGNPKRLQTADKQTIYCDSLTAHLLPTGDVKEIHFEDQFKHVQDTRTVSSNKAIYYGAQGKTDLIGEPEINDESFKITSDSMEIFEETSGIKAKGNVKSTFVQRQGKTPATLPFSSPSQEPVYISSENMEWDSQKSEAIYTGKAKLWQEKNVITADKMVINDKDKTMSAYNKVHTIFYNSEQRRSKKGKKGEKGDEKAEKADDQQEQKDEKLLAGDEREEGPISVDSEIMNYAEKDRIIHFEKNVKIVTPSTRITSEKADFYLKQEESDFDRLYAQGKVTITHEQKKGTGTEATFYADERKMVLEGNPKLTEPGKADILGRVLTLFLADDRILIDGQEDGRATTTLQMKGGPVSPPNSSNKNKDARLTDRRPD